VSTVDLDNLTSQTGKISINYYWAIIIYNNYIHNLFSVWKWLNMY